MRLLQVNVHLSDQKLKQKLAESKNTPVFNRWQIVYLIQVAGQQQADIIAPLVGLSRHAVYKIVEAYNKKGSAAMIQKPRGGRRRSLLSLVQEEAVFKSIEQMAAQGLIKTAHDMRSVVEKQVGRPVSDDYLWDLLHRHGWKKKVPRPHHPKRSKAGQEAFKKNSPKGWMPQH